jgi:hypothetical protein
MKNTNTGGPAFPTGYDEEKGVSMRDYFAAKMAQIFTPDWIDVDDHESMISCATMAYKMADAMLKAREQ